MEEDMQEIFSDLKNCILVFEYPLADSMNDDEIADIFNRSNRCFLVAWIINLLNEACDGTLQNMNNTEAYLANLIYNMGFCQKKESIPFMRGQLPIKAELKIIQKIFNALKRAKQSVPRVDISNGDIELLKRKDLNLFPMYGDIKLADPKVKIQLGIMPRLSNSNIPEKVETTEKINRQIDLSLRKLQDELPKFTDTIRELEKDTNSRNNERVEVNSESLDILKKCDKNLKIISQYLTDRKTIAKFNNSDWTHPPSTESPNKQWRDMLKDMTDQCAELAELANLRD